MTKNIWKELTPFERFSWGFKKTLRSIKYGIVILVISVVFGSGIGAVAGQLSTDENPDYEVTPHDKFYVILKRMEKIEEKLGE